MKPIVTELTFSIEENVSDATDFLAAASGLSKTKVKDAMKKGAVWLQRKRQNKRLRRATAALFPGDQVSIYYSDQIIKTIPVEPELIADREKYSLWFKPPGLLSSGSRFGDHCAINRWVESHFKPQRPVFLVHRLDRNASGIILLAHTKQVAANLSRQFHDREVVKKYQVEVDGHFPAECTINTLLDNKEAITKVKVSSYNTDSSVLDVIIETGRKHQIRRHLSNIGYPVVGDKRLGGSESDRIHLVARYLSFTCPVSDEMVNWQLPAEHLDFLNRSSSPANPDFSHHQVVVESSSASSQLSSQGRLEQKSSPQTVSTHPPQSPNR